MTVKLLVIEKIFASLKKTKIESLIKQKVARFENREEKSKIFDFFWLAFFGYFQLTHKGVRAVSKHVNKLKEQT